MTFSLDVPPHGLSRHAQTLRQAAALAAQVACRGKPHLVCVGGWHGYDNLGDEALHAAIPRLFPRFGMIDYRGGLHRLFPRVCRGDVAALLGGGTLINRGVGWLRLAQQYSSIKGPFAVFGTGVADPEAWRNVPAWHDTLGEWAVLLREAPYVGVRGPLSAAMLEEKGIHAQVVGDPALAFAARNIPADDRPPRQRLGLNLTSSPHLWGSQDAVLANLANLAQRARAARWSIAWYVVSPEDLALTRRLATQTGTADEIICVYRDPERYLREVRRVSVFVGMRLHAVVLALCALVPSLMLEYRPKCRDFMLSVGMSEACIRTDRFAAEDVWNTVLSWDVHRASRSREVFEALNPLRRTQEMQAAELAAQLAEHP